MRKYYVGIDLGGTKITTGISDSTGRIIEKSTIPTGSADGEIAVMNRIIESVENVLEISDIAKDELIAIGIGSPGPLSSKEGKIIETPNLPFKNFNLIKPLGEKYNVPVFLDNDGNVAAIGEYLFGAGRGFENVIYITVSTGVGAGAVLNGKPYNGSNSNALEIGHMTINPDSPHRCNCGNFGDVEALASGTAITKRAHEAINEGKNTLLSSYERVTPFEVYEAHKEGDKVATKILEDAFKYMGICVGNVILTFDPDVIAIGGGVTNIGDFFFDSVREEAKKRVFKNMFETVKIVKSELNQDTGVQGAIALAIIKSK